MGAIIKMITVFFTNNSCPEYLDSHTIPWEASTDVSTCVKGLRRGLWYHVQPSVQLGRVFQMEGLYKHMWHHT